MKKLLITLASIGLIATPVTTVVSCFGTNDKKTDRDYLDLWDADRYAKELSDLKYEILDDNNYRLISEKFGLDFIIQKNEKSGMKYEVANKSIRIKDLDINNYDKTNAIDTYVAFAATEDQLPNYKQYREDEKGKSLNDSNLIRGEVEAQNIEISDVTDPLFKKVFYFDICEDSVNNFWFERMTYAHWISEINLKYDEVFSAEQLREYWWVKLVEEVTEKAAVNSKQNQDFNDHFKKYAKITMDSNYDPKEFDEQFLVNKFEYVFNDSKFDFDFNVNVLTNQEVIIRP
ncbi:lipoprotein [Spiroplasma alleghenense]|uniref:Lipoprotein n=1 Tax=Spiroplasma alleghenense TaxID=216931 RepID=A0A345Z2H3_9MOLU|nr:lipoprotein [Spiroplasma alleghenense]AXK50802.1 hypothetical protein SALLE_v1c01260 [Spiroplasma alleghenense]